MNSPKLSRRVGALLVLLACAGGGQAAGAADRGRGGGGAQGARDLSPGFPRAFAGAWAHGGT